MRREPQVIVLGNQKSGTTAVARLLAEFCGLTATIDIPRRWRRDGYALARGKLSFAALVNRRPALFASDLIKIPGLTFVADQVVERFPNSQIVFVLRDPRDNIRSLLNRQNTPGHLERLPTLMRWKVTLQRRPMVDSSIWGGGDENYVGVLARRWNLAVDALESLGRQAHLLKYEVVVADKQASLDDLVQRFHLEPKHDISDRLDKQFQPAGNRNVTWQEVFGEENLGTIERICGERMKRFGYEIDP